MRIDLGDANEGLGNLKKKIFSPDISERSENSQQAIEVRVHQRDKKKIQKAKKYRKPTSFLTRKPQH